MDRPTQPRRNWAKFPEDLDKAGRQGVATASEQAAKNILPGCSEQEGISHEVNALWYISLIFFIPFHPNKQLP